MKFGSTILAKFSGIKLPKLGGLKFKTALWAIAIALLVVLFFWILLGRFILHKDERIAVALESGQRIEVSLATGEVKGKISKSENAESKGLEDVKKAETPDSHEAKQADNNPQEDKKTPEEKKEENPLAWMEQDFIGPRLPDGVMEALLGDELVKSKIVVDSVSIKDISAKPIVVIIIKGVGLSSSSTREALELPKEITMGFSPYSPLIEDWVKKAKETKHEVILNIPMETKDYQVDNPGPYSLVTQSSDEDNTTRLKMLLGLVKEYSAVYSENNEIFTRSANNIKPVLELLKKESKYFVYGGGYSNYSLIQVADGMNYPILVNDVVLDDDISTNAINDKFVELEKIAKEKGYVVVMAHPYPITIRMIKAWLPKVEEKGLVISPVSLLLGKVFK